MHDQATADVKNLTHPVAAVSWHEVKSVKYDSWELTVLHSRQTINVTQA